MDATEPTARFVVLAAIDRGPLDAEVVRVSANFAQDIRGGELHLIHVIEDLPPPVGFVPRPAGLGITAGEITASGRKCLEELATTARSSFTGPVVGHLVAGSASKQILQVASDLQADVVLVGTHGRKGIKRMLLGSVAEAVVRKASCPVIVVRVKDYHGFLPPEIEPGCTDCLRVQNETHGAGLWCARHAEGNPRAHVCYELPKDGAEGAKLAGETDGAAPRTALPRRRSPVARP
jgi:nucleotide-binding universal stress UspA family protein